MNDKTTDKIVSCVWEIFPILFALIRRRWTKGNKDGLSVYHYETLGILRNRNKMSMSEIQQCLEIAKPNVTPIIDSLINKGLVSRNIDKIDRRIINISLTYKGKKFMSRGMKLSKEDIKDRFGIFSDKDLMTLETSFENIRNLLSQLNNGRK